MLKTKHFLVFAGILVLAVLAIFIWGCTNTLDGEKTANNKPIVYFVNIPPEGQTFSRNPVVYWVGADKDGQIDYFRYHVATLDEIGSLTPDDYIETVPAAEWVILDVDHTKSDPKTTNTVEMSASLEDPVNTFVVQYVFVQAYDEEGLGSDIVHRQFSRNDNPPETVVYGFSLDSPFVNSETPGGVITGVKMRWGGSDQIDYPSDPPPFEYEWKLYGPYTDSVFYNVIVDSFFTQVYVSSDAKLYRLGDTVFQCNVYFTGGEADTICDTILVTETIPTTAFGGLEDYFRCTDPDFVDREDLNLVADSSGDGFNTWVSEESDTIYDVYGKYYDMLAQQGITVDTTIEMNYVFVIKSRDDANVADLSPEFKTFTVIDPHYERDVAVIDFADASAKGHTIRVDKDSIHNGFTLSVADFWGNLLRNWKPDIDFDANIVVSSDPNWRNQSPDYIRTTYIDLKYDIKLVELLKHKILIIYHDDIRYPNFNNRSEPIYTAIDAGVNVWVTARCLLFGSLKECETNVDIPSDFNYYFGVEGTVFSGWTEIRHGTSCSNSGNVADFVGAYSMDSTKWPNLAIDTAYLHNRFEWRYLGLVWNPNLPCLPEVNWASRGTGTEVMYLYKSFYGDSHPMGSDFIYEGSPLAHRKSTTMFRTVHCSFTPYALDSLQMQVLADTILTWLYPENLGEQSSSVVNRYKNAPVKVSLEDAQDNFVRRREESLRAKEDMLDVILR